MPKGSQNYDSISMVDRAMQIINEIYRIDLPVGVSELAYNLNLPKATVYRILNTLLKWDVVVKDENDKYSLGLIFIQYSEKVKSEISINSIAMPFMLELSKTTGEFINLGIINDDNVVTISSINGESSALVSRLIPVSPLHCSSMGKIFLSYKSDAEIQDYFRRHNQKRTINTITTYNDFLNERNKILSNGISQDNEEYEYGLGCIAAPVFNYENEVIAAIGVSGPISRMNVKGMNTIEKKLRVAANNISDKLHLAKLDNSFI